MQHLILAFYVLFFSTGFMGGAALLFLRLRSGERLLNLFLAFQLLFIAGLGLVASYFYFGNVAFAVGGPGGGMGDGLRLGIGIASSLVNGAVYLVAVAVVRRLGAGPRANRGAAQVAAGLALLVVAQTLASTALATAAHFGSSAAAAVMASGSWHFGGYVFSGLALAAFGFVALRAAAAEERAAIRRLLRGYGRCALAFAPFGLAEWALNELGVQPWKPLSLDYLFFLGWNLVSVGACALSLRRGEAAGTALGAIPEETAAALGLTARERDMALMIARGLANKEIAAECGISPATVRTHIYNLYRKVGARSRVELINRLRG